MKSIRTPPKKLPAGACILAGGLLAATTLVGDLRAARNSGEITGSIVVGGVRREYLVHVPATRSSSSAEGGVPLVFVFHGGGGHARSMPLFTKFDAIADDAGFVVAYPQSLDRGWNASLLQVSAAEDVGFIRALIAELEQQYHINPKRIYSTGISSGGFFSNRLACEMTGQIAAIASVAATMAESLAPVCNPSRPISVLYMHGTKDPIVHIEGGAILRTRGRNISLVDAAKFWRDWDQTSAKSQEEDLPTLVADGTSVHRSVWSGGKQGTEVVVYTIEGGGHAWPDALQYLPAFMVGKVSHNLDASRAIWEFFRTQSIP